MKKNPIIKLATMLGIRKNMIIYMIGSDADNPPKGNAVSKKGPAKINIKKRRNGIFGTYTPEKTRNVEDIPQIKPKTAII